MVKYYAKNKFLPKITSFHKGIYNSKIIYKENYIKFNKSLKRFRRIDAYILQAICN